jgi:hypothetical protein
LFRYAEILLNYAEAMVNAYGDPDYTGSYSLSARDAVNQVRNRGDVKMPAYPADMSKDAFLKRLKNERRVEFAFEDNRFFDARRWAKAEEWFSKPVYKVTVTGSLENPTYTRSLLEERIFLSKCYHFPIPQQEVDNSQNIEQNAGW